MKYSEICLKCKGKGSYTYLISERILFITKKRKNQLGIKIQSNK